MMSHSRLNRSFLPDLYIQPSFARRTYTAPHRSPNTNTSSGMNSPGPSPVDIQHHLYMSFLEARTADVALRVSGNWHAIYRLHRVVLIQSGFFRSLFTAGFVESSPRLGGHHRGPDEIDIVFDDRNITRAAFEVCISRLYGGGPPLHTNPSLIPTASQPLTPFFPNAAPDTPLPDGHHPATPRFLLSLLATAVYLSIPSLASQALNTILGSVGPHTVIQYLQFALGKPIESGEESLEPEAAVGLEHVAELIEVEEEEDEYEHDAGGSSSASVQTTKGEPEKSHGQDLDIKKEDPSEPTSPFSPYSLPSSASSAFSDVGTIESSTHEPSFHYGSISDKIGEAAACWLARWGPDILAYEERKVNLDSKDTPDLLSSPIQGIWSLPQTQARRRAKTIPTDTTSTNFTKNNANATDTSNYAIPVIWARGGLDAKWVSALVCADTLFVRDERARYEFARNVVELRRSAGVDQGEEKEWVKMFETGIYYANMSMEDIISISQDISPITGQPFVPLSTLQAAHWSHSILRHQITVRPSPSPTSSSSSTHTNTTSGSSPPPRDKELGITETTADVLARISRAPGDNTKLYYLVPGDSSLRIGDNGTMEGGSMDQLFGISSSHSTTSASPFASPEPNNITTTTTTNSPSRATTSESTFFGLLPSQRTASACISSDPTSKSRWSPHPPFRFAVEFWDLESLREKSRLHSHTIWYGGSLFNVYAQIVRKKGQVQLGIYLHRQSSVDPIPASSAPSPLIGREKEREREGRERSHTQTHVRGPSLPAAISSSPSSPSMTSHYSPSIHPPSRSTTPISPSSASYHSTPNTPTITGASTSQSTFTIPATAPPVTPQQPYRDPRPSISAYFTISCASATGSSQTRFTSAPDVFSVSQSWGWKSSSLRTEEYMDVGGEAAGVGGGGSGGRSGVQGKEVSLRATVVLGLV